MFIHQNRIQQYWFDGICEQDVIGSYAELNKGSEEYTEICDMLAKSKKRFYAGDMKITTKSVDEKITRYLKNKSICMKY